MIQKDLNKTETNRMLNLRKPLSLDPFSSEQIRLTKVKSKDDHLNFTTIT